MLRSSRCFTYGLAKCRHGRPTLDCPYPSFSLHLPAVYAARLCQRYGRPCHRNSASPGNSQRRKSMLLRMKKDRESSTPEAYFLPSADRSRTPAVPIGQWLSVPASCGCCPAGLPARPIPLPYLPLRFVIGSASFRCLEIVPSRGHSADEDRPLTSRIHIGVQPSQQKSDIAPEFAGTCLWACTEHAVTVGMGGE